MYDAADDAAIVRPLDTPVHPSAGGVRSDSIARRLAKTDFCARLDPQKDESRHMESGLSWLRSRFNEF
jgi:hypothetical protein